MEAHTHVTIVEICLLVEILGGHWVGGRDHLYAVRMHSFAHDIVEVHHSLLVLGNPRSGMCQAVIHGHGTIPHSWRRDSSWEISGASRGWHRLEITRMVHWRGILGTCLWRHVDDTRIRLT
jgi:hypothetical protein